MARDAAAAEEPERTEQHASVEELAKGTLRRLLAPDRSYVLVRFAILRAVGFVYFFAFLSLANQVKPLLGAQGILPAAHFLERVGHALATRGESPFLRLPSLFWWIGASDGVLVAGAWLGVALAFAVMIGLTNAIAMVVLWALYLSYAHVGQIFFGYGWESQLSETGLLAAFLCPIDSLRPFPARPPPNLVVWLFRWLTARIYLGAGLIKLRGDPCWRDLTCLVWHFETQPNPSPLSWVFHALPVTAKKAGVVVNHLVEVVAPFFAFAPRRARIVAGTAFLAFQLVLIASGNLSFLNWLTIVPAIACFDDDALARLVPRRFTEEHVRRAKTSSASDAHKIAAGVYGLLVGLLSLGPLENLLSDRQAMNRTYDPFDLVNTYGAFGSVGRERYEVVLEGTRASTLDDATEWLAYELPCKPGDPKKRPCLVTPYHYRLDWQIWFAAFGRFEQQAWLARLIDQLLAGNKTVASLFAKNPFPDAPPRFVRARLYRYEMTRPFDGSGVWWRRTLAREYLRPVGAGDPWLQDLLARHGFGATEDEE